MTKGKMLLSLTILMLAYIGLLIFNFNFKGSIGMIVGISSFLLYFIFIIYNVTVSTDMSPNFFKTLKELEEKQKEANTEWARADKVVKEIGTYEAVKYITEKRRRQKIKAYPKNHM